MFGDNGNISHHSGFDAVIELIHLHRQGIIDLQIIDRTGIGDVDDGAGKFPQRDRVKGDRHLLTDRDIVYFQFCHSDINVVRCQVVDPDSENVPGRGR